MLTYKFIISDFFLGNVVRQFGPYPMWALEHREDLSLEWLLVDEFFSFFLLKNCWWMSWNHYFLTYYLNTLVYFIYFIWRFTIFLSHVCDLCLCVLSTLALLSLLYNSHLFIYLFIFILVLAFFFHRISCIGSSNCGIRIPHLYLKIWKFLPTHSNLYLISHAWECHLMVHKYFFIFHN